MENLAIETRRRITHSLEQLGFNRGSRLGGAHGLGHREWLHFCVHADDAALIANFSAFALRDESSSDETMTPRLTVVACNGNDWRGTTEAYDTVIDGLPGGSFGARMGGNEVALEGGNIRLRVACDRAGIDADLVLEPSVPAAPSHNVLVAGSPPLNWVVVPRLLASGTVRIGERERRLDRAPAYHDHNWGAFRWGADFRWEWGYALPVDPESPWAVVAVRLTNRTRTVVLEQGVLVWHGTELVRTFRADDVEYATSGLLRRSPAVRVPSVLSLLRPGSATDVPRSARFRARAGDDAIDVTFFPDAVAQILVPDDVGPSITAIQEARSRIEVRGRVAGRDIHFDTTGFLELLGR